MNKIKPTKLQPATKLSILIPVRNEGMNIKIMVKLLMAILETSYEVLIIYDSPKDEGLPIMKSLAKQYSQVRPIYNDLGKGIANAVKSGIKAAVGDYILIFAADEVGPILAIEDMLYLMDHGCDLVSCTRYAYGGRRLGGSLMQGILSKMANWLFHKLIGTSLTDSTTGIKIIRKKILQKIRLDSNVGWAVVFELAIKAQLADLQLGEVPIISIDRLYGGKSSFTLGPWFKEYLRLFIYGAYKLHQSSRKRIVALRVPQATAV